MRRAGAALPMVIFAITMASALAVGGAFVSRQLAASARLGQRADLLAPAAEGALVNAIAGWDSVARAADTLGHSAALSGTTSDGLQTSVWVTRVSPACYWMVAEAISGARPVLRRRIGVLVRSISGVPTIVSGHGWSDLP